MPDDKKKKGIQVDWDAFEKDSLGVGSVSVDWDAFQKDQEQEEWNKNLAPEKIIKEVDPSIKQYTQDWMMQVHVGNTFTKTVANTVASAFDRLDYDMGYNPTDTWDPRGFLIGALRQAGNLSSIITGQFSNPANQMNNDIKRLEKLIYSDEELKQKAEHKVGVLESAKQRREYLDELLPSNPIYQDNFLLTDVPDALGSTTGFVMAGALFRSPIIGSAVMGSLAESQGMMDDAYNYTKDLDTIEKVGDIGMVLGSTEAIPISNLFNKIAKFGGDPAKKLLRKGFLGLIDRFNAKAEKQFGQFLIKESTIQGLEEFTQEFGQQIGENITAQQLYDINREIIGDAPRGGAAGFVSGVLMFMVGAGISHGLKIAKNEKDRKVLQKALNEQQEALNNVFAKAIEGTSYGTGVSNVFHAGLDGINIEPSTFTEEDKGTLDQEKIAIANDAVATGYGNDIVEVAGEDKDTNIVRSIFKMGIRGLERFTKAFSSEKQKLSVGVPLDALKSLTQEEMSNLVDDLYHRSIALGIKHGITDQIDLGEIEGDDKFLKQLKNDITSAIVLDFKKTGLDLLKAKYSNLGSESLAKIIKNIEDVKSQNKNILAFGQAAIEASSNQLGGWINQKEVKSLTKKILEESKRRLEAKDEDFIVEPIDPDEKLYEAEAWHGSPYSWTKVDKTKRGTGEGAAAYGVGALYTTTKKKVAEWYAEALAARKAESDSHTNWELVRLLLSDIPLSEFFWSDVHNSGKIRELMTRRTELKYEQTIKENILSEALQTDQTTIEEELEMDLSEGSYIGGGTFTLEEYQLVIDGIKDKISRIETAILELDHEPKVNRNLYKLKLWEGKEQNLLDWDNQLSKEQIQAIKSQANKEGFSIDHEKLVSLGRDAYNYLSKVLGEQKETFGWRGYQNDKEASAFLSRAGFDGIQYIGDTSGATNYVVFDEDAIKIVEHKQYEEEDVVDVDETAKRGSSTDLSYGDVLKQYNLDKLEPKSVSEIFAIFEEQGLFEPEFKPLVRFLQKELGDIKMHFVPFAEVDNYSVPDENTLIPGLLADDKSGVTGVTGRNEAGKPIILINTSANPKFSRSVYRTMIHESIHALLYKYQNTPEGKLFMSKLEKIAKDLRQIYKTKDPRFISNYAVKGIKSIAKGNSSIALLFGLDRIIDPETGQVIRVEESTTDSLLTNGTLHELLTYTLSGNVDIVKLFSQINMGPNSNGLFRQIWDAIAKFLEKHFGAFKATDVSSGTLYETLVTLFEKEKQNIEQALKSEKARREERVRKALAGLSNNKAEAQGFDDAEATGVENLADALDTGQEDVEVLDETDIATENIQTNAITEFFAMMFEKDKDLFREQLKSLSYSQFKSLVDKFAPKNSELRKALDERLNEYYNTLYRKYGISYEDFERALMVRIINRAQEVSRKQFYNLEVRHYPKQVVGTGLVPLGKEFRDSDNKRASSFTESTVIEQYADKLNGIFGLPPGSIKIAYINSIVNVKIDSGRNRTVKGKTNIKKLSDYVLGQEEGTGNHSARLAEIIANSPDRVNDRTLMYIGNMGDKSTLPVLSIDNKVWDRFLDGAELYSEFYSKISGKEAGLSETLRAVLEDMWYGAKFQSQYDDFGEEREDVPKYLVESIVAGKDWNKTQKRGTKWVFSIRKMQQDWDLIKDLFAVEDSVDINSSPKYNPYKYPGIEVNPATGEIRFRTAVMNTTQYEEFPIVTIVNDKGEKVEYNLNDLLRNKYDGKSRFDGASFYVMGHFDAIYHRVYGTFKRGTLKNVISTQYGDENPEFIKHAMHALHPNDPLAQWMIKNGISILVADESAKIHSYGQEIDGKLKTSISLGELQAGLPADDKRLFWVPIDNISRYKEEHNVAFYSGKSRQAWNGSSMTSLNPYIASDNFDEALGALMRGILRKYRFDINDHDIDSAIKDIKNIVLAPNITLPKQRTVSSILNNVFRRGLTDEQIKSELMGLLHHPLVASQINNRVKDMIADALSMTITGARVALGPGGGMLMKASQVDIITSDANVTWHLTSLPLNHEAFKAAVPDDRIRELMKDLREIRRRIALLARKTKKNSDKRILKETEEHMERIKLRISDRALQLMEEIQSKVAEGDKDAMALSLKYAQAIVRDGHRQNINALIDMSNDEVKKWRDEYIYGKPTKNEDGTLNWANAKGGIIDRTTGHLKHGWGLISYDISMDYHAKPGDKAMSIVTPSDSPMAVGTFRVAAVIPKGMSENRKVILNSEYIQSLEGKDYDIDTTSLIFYDEDYWQYFLGENNKIHDSFDIVSDFSTEEKHLDYLKGIAKETNRLFKEKASLLATLPGALDKEGQLIEATPENVMSDEIRMLYMQLLLGTTDIVGKRSFSMFGEEFHKINDAYMVKDIASVINLRLYHTLASSIGLKLNQISVPNFDSNGNLTSITKMNLSVDNKDWFRTHVMHMIMTNHIVDFPNNTSKLTYQHDLRDLNVRKKIFGLTWGVPEAKLKNMPIEFIDIFEDIQHFLFGRMFNLAKDKNPLGEKYTLFDMIKDVELQKIFFNSIQQGDMASLSRRYIENLEEAAREAKLKYHWLEEKKKQIDQSLRVSRVAAQAIFAGLEIEDLSNYPLAYLIENINVKEVPMYGLPAKESIIIESMVGKDIALSDPVAAELLKDKILPAITEPKHPLREYFMSKSRPRGVYPAIKGFSLEGNPTTDTIALSLLAMVRNPELDKVRRASLALILGLDETMSSSTIGREPFLNQEARSKSYPILFRKLLENAFVSTIGMDTEVRLYTEGTKSISKDSKFVTLSTDTDGQLFIRDTRGDNHRAKEILDAKDLIKEEIDSLRENYKDLTKQEKKDLALAQLKKLLLERGGVWESPRNRRDFSRYINFVENINMEDRKILFLDYVNKNLISNPEFGYEDTQIFWMSLMGQVWNDGLREGRGMNLSFNRAQVQEEKPYQYPYNDTLLEMLSKSDKLLADYYLASFNKYAKENTVDLKLVVESIVREEPTELPFLGEETGTEGSNETIHNTLLENIHHLDTKIFLRKEFRAFNKILDGPNGISEGIKALRKLYTDVDVLRTLNESGYDYSDVLKDLHHLTKTEFEKKYSSFEFGPVDDAFRKHAFLSENKISSNLSIDKTKNKLRQLFWIQFKVKRNEILSNKLPKHIQGWFSDENWAHERERKVYANYDKDELIGFSLVPGTTRPQPLTPEKVARKFRIVPDTTWKPVGVASTAIRKASDLDLSLSYYQEEMKNKLSEIERIIDLFRDGSKRIKYATVRATDVRLKTLLSSFKDSELSELAIRRKIFNLAENMLDRDGFYVIENLSEGIGKGRFLFVKQGKENILYNSPLALLEAEMPNLSNEDKLAYVAAFEYRKMYDVIATDVVTSALNYIEATYEEMTKDFDMITEGIKVVADTGIVYEQYKDAMARKRGNYMPHSYPGYIHEQIWKEKNYEKIKSALLEQIRAEETKRKNGVHYDPRLLGLTGKEINKIVEDRLESGWKRVAPGMPDTTFIPNFQKRMAEDPEVDYDRISFTPHTEYIVRTIEGVKNDLKIIDWYLFLKNAREAGESAGVIDSVKHFFASQVTNKLLHSKRIKISNLKKGMNISFLVRGLWINDEFNNPVETETRVSGIVRKVTKDRIYLFIEPGKAIIEAKRRLKVYEKIHKGIQETPGNMPATAGQIKYFKELVNDGFVEDLTPEQWGEITIKSLNDKIFAALNQAIKNPDKLGSYRLDYIYSRDLSGNITEEYVDRFIREGAIEYLERMAQEIYNKKSIIGYWEAPVLDRIAYGGLKTLSFSLDKASAGYRKAMGYVLLALFNAPKSLARNAWGFIMNNFLHSPRRSVELASEGVQKYISIRKGNFEKMDDEEKFIYNTLASMSLMNTTSVLNMAMGTINLDRPEVLLERKGTSTIVRAFKLFSEATGYSEYISKLKKLDKAFREESDSTKKSQIRGQIELLNKRWILNLQGILEKGKSYTNTEIAILYRELEKKDINELKINESAQLGITKKKALLLFSKALFNMFYESLFTGGMKVQALAEYGRVATMMVGYYMARETNHSRDTREALQYGINYTEAWNAMYKAQNKQRSANTKLGRSLMQFTQYYYNALSKSLRLYRDSIPQRLGEYPEGFIPKLKALITRDITTIEEQVKKLQNQDYVSLKDVNLSRLALIRWLSHLTLLQIGVTGVVKGAQYIVDPTVQFAFGLLKLIKEIGQYAFGDDDDEELKENLIEGAYEVLWMYGVPYKQALGIMLRPKDVTIVQAATSGRIAQQFGNLERIVNSAGIFFGEDEMTRKDKKKTLLDPTYILNTMLGVELFGTKMYASQGPQTVETSNWLLGDREYRIPNWEGIEDPNQPFLTPEDRARLLYENAYKVLPPFGPIIFY